MKRHRTSLLIATIATALFATNVIAAAKSDVHFGKSTDELTSFSLNIGRFQASSSFNLSRFDSVGFWSVLKQSYLPSLADTPTSAFSGLTAATGPSLIGGFNLEPSPQFSLPDLGPVDPPAVPEPSTVVGGCLALGMLAFMQRRRMKRLFTSRPAMV